MTFDQFLQLIGIITGTIASAISARWGHKQVLQKLDNYVTIHEYRKKTTHLHEEIDGLKDKLLIHEERNVRPSLA